MRLFVALMLWVSFYGFLTNPEMAGRWLARASIAYHLTWEKAARP